jgi:thiol-disulfide isomerase/thioredoxin
MNPSLQRPVRGADGGVSRARVGKRVAPLLLAFFLSTLMPRFEPSCLAGAGLGSAAPPVPGAGPIQAGEAAAPGEDPGHAGKGMESPGEPPAAAIPAVGLRARRKAIEDRRGAPLLVNFWATWCQPCVEELPDLAGVERQFAASHLKVLGVSLDLVLEDDSPAIRRSVARVLRKAGVAYPNVMYEGPPDPLISAFDLPGEIPHTILYGANGKVIARWKGIFSVPELGRALARPRPKTRTRS